MSHPRRPPSRTCLDALANPPGPVDPGRCPLCRHAVGPLPALHRVEPDPRPGELPGESPRRKRAYRRQRPRIWPSVAELKSRIVAEQAREQAVRRRESRGTRGRDGVRETEHVAVESSSGDAGVPAGAPGLGHAVVQELAEKTRQRGVESWLKGRLDELVVLAARVDDVPVVADLVAVVSWASVRRAGGAVGVARGFAVQLVGLHSPADLAIVGHVPGQRPTLGLAGSGRTPAPCIAPSPALSVTSPAGLRRARRSTRRSGRQAIRQEGRRVCAIRASSS